jgi:hypothetical protein
MAEVRLYRIEHRTKLESVAYPCRFKVSNFVQISVADARRFATIEPLPQGDMLAHFAPSVV